MRPADLAIIAQPSPEATMCGQTTSAPSREQRADLVVVAVLASIFAGVLAWGGAKAPLGSNDFFREAAPAYLLLARGHLLDFLQQSPLYGGSLILRAPFAMVAPLFGGGIRAIYAASVLPCMAVAVAFTVWIAAQLRGHGRGPWVALSLAILCCLANPYVALLVLAGHPEELLGAVLCVAAVLAASSGRATWAGLLLGLAFANKQWALVAAPVVVAALPAGRRRAVLVAGAAAALFLVPLAAARHDHLVTGGAVSTGPLFLPPQLWWWLGPQSWIAHSARLVVVSVSLAIVLGWFRLPNRAKFLGLDEALLMLALVFLVRTVLDPWNNVTYATPFLLSLLVFEVRAGRTPILTLLCAATLWVVIQHMYGWGVSGDGRAAAYAAVTLPMLALLAARLYAPHAFARLTVLPWSHGVAHRGLR